MEELYVKSPIDAPGVTKDKPYKVLSILDKVDKTAVYIIDDDGWNICILTEEGNRNCAFLNDEHKWQFFDKDGNDINK